VHAGGKYYMGEVPTLSNIFYEVKVRDPHGVIIDTTAHGWGGASKDGTGQDVHVKLRNEGLVAERADLAEKAS
jgi:hypothetical protein